MAKLTTNHLLFWFGNTSYPSGFSRYAPTPALDAARFLSGAGAGGLGTEAGGTGGSLTHTHSGISHGHASNTHTHSYEGQSFTHDTTGTAPTDGASSSNMALVTHAHPSGTGASGTTDYTGVGTDVSDANTSGETTPPFTEAVLLVPNADGTEVPASAVVLYESATPPTGFELCDASHHSAPDIDLSEKYIRIMANGSNPSGTPATGGNAADGHTHPIVAHTHTASNHSHGDHLDLATTEVTSANIGVAQAQNGFDPAHHTITWTTEATAVNTALTVTNSAGTDHLPAGVRLAPIKKTGSSGMADGIIVGYIGLKATLQALADWKYCDGTNGTPQMESFNSSNRRQPICAFTSIGDVGGSGGGGDDHAHAFAQHAHAASANHSHSVTNDVAAKVRRITTTAGTYMRHAISHSHSNEHTWVIGSSSQASGLSNHATHLTAATDHRAPYLEVLWAKYAPTTQRSYGMVIG